MRIGTGPAIKIWTRQGEEDRGACSHRNLVEEIWIENW